jgi:glycerol-3-phosphate O-acyltransferase
MRIMTSILDKASIRSELQQIAAADARPTDVVRAEAESDLAEMRGRRNPLAVRLFAALSRFVYRRGYHRHPVYDLEEVERVRAASRERSVVFLVTHKTYLDFFVLFDFLYRQGIPTPYIFGGLNMNFAGFGALARRAGGIFIRRSFRDDPVYKAVLRRYIESLIEQGACFMWAIEGTRSRTGKLVMPRLGLLNYVSDASRGLGEGATSFIPVSVVYDQIPDVVDIAAQEAGADKKPESLSWFMEYLRGLGGPFGYIHIRFGDAMVITETPDAPELDAARKRLGRRQLEIQKLAFEVCYRINEITPATMTSLVLMVLLCRGRCDEDQVRNDVGALSNYIIDRDHKIILKRPSRELGDDPAESIDSLITTGVLIADGTGAGTPAPVTGKRNSPRWLEIAPDRLSVAIYYSNMAVHHFVIAAFTELALIASMQAPAAYTPGDFFSECLRLRNLFKFEFFFSRKAVFQNQLMLELESLEPEWQTALQEGEPGVARILKQKPLLVGAGVLSPFVTAYRWVGEMIASDAAGRQLTQEAFIAKCLEWANRGSQHDGARNTPGVSRALLANGLRVADSRGLRTGEEPRDDKKRADFLEELQITAHALSTLDAIAHSDGR